jgi:dTMP kinase
VGQLIAIEGQDGAGKSTLAEGLTAAWERAGASVARTKFPRYHRSVHADLIQEILYRQHGDAGESVYGMGLLYALDRRDAVPDIQAALANHDVLLIDRYVASNAAYQAARLHQDAAGEVVEWVRKIEVERFGIPVPDAQVLLQLNPEVAVERMERRTRVGIAADKDFFEADDDLQTRCAKVYAQLADARWLSPWYSVDSGSELDIDSLAAELLG